MTDKFVIDGVTYLIVKNPKPILVREDSLLIENRKEICRKFLRLQGWREDMFIGRTTNDLEREIYKILVGDKKEPKRRINHNHSSKRREDVPNPSEKEVEYWLKKWDELEDYVAQEDAIDKLFFGELNANDNLQNILIKCSVLNDFYSTNIFKIYPVAKHILSLNIDNRLRKGDSTLVDDIARVDIGGKEKNFYSFASKYCSHHNELEFPIYDSYVHKVLIYFRNVDKFFSFQESDLKIYPKFKNVLIEFRKFYKLDKYNLKELDKYLWQFGKHYFPKNY